VAYGLVAPNQASFGTHWGNRFLLGLYPIFGLLAAVNLAEWARGIGGGGGIGGIGEARRIGRRPDWRLVPVALVILVSLAAQVYSIEVLRKKEDFSVRLNAELAKRPEAIVVTNIWWAPSEMCLEFSNKAIFLAKTQQDFDRLVQTLGPKGYDQFLFVTQTPDAQAAAAEVTVDDRGLGFFTLRFFPVEVHPQ